MYGVTHFDPAAVASLVRRDPGAITEEGMQCPLLGHGELLAWREGQPRAGTEWHADPEVRFHVSPTYVLRHFRDNLIAGHDVIAGTFAKKAEKERLGHENSEDALSWNVFRSLQEAGALSLAACPFTGAPSGEEPDLYLWGQRLTAGGVLPGEEFERARLHLEPGLTQATEPDVCLHLAGFGWLFIEAKFGSPTGAARSDEYFRLWRERYRESCKDIFIWDSLDEAEAADVPEQLLRNAAYAHYLADEDERAVVVALVREADRTPIEDRFRRFCTDTVEFRRATWESIYRVLADTPEFSALRAYFENKTLNLRPAFRLNGEPDRSIRAVTSA